MKARSIQTGRVELLDIRPTPFVPAPLEVGEELGTPGHAALKECKGQLREALRRPPPQKGALASASLAAAKWPTWLNI